MATKAKIKEPKLTDGIKSEPSNTVAPVVEEREEARDEKYYESVGRRKNAIARVRLITRKSTDSSNDDERAILNVNGKDYFDYFKEKELHEVVEGPFRKLKSLNRFKATIKVLGGGIRGQADAIAHGLARSLILFDANFSKKLAPKGAFSYLNFQLVSTPFARR
ncbi:MAG: 30S ribosomal protein S9 [Parcubacteria group bacterium GW2011_GWB1_48_6]|nr:MAG: 30S ribosomal protein S9 [Parcubacteria group bacterium GW2011_GWB1_48_6]